MVISGCRLLCALAAGGLVGAPLSAQDESPREEPIIVTGERSGRTLFETASSVAITTESDLENQPETERLDELIAITPNVTLGSGGLGPTIRGQDTTGVLRDLSAFLGGNRPRTTLVIDGRPASYGEFVFGSQPLWDVSKVEIFRSPQTTTQGRNSIAGAIFVESNPAEHDFSARLRMVGGNYDTLQLSAAVTGPFLKDQLAFRVAADRHRSEPASQLSGGRQSVDPNSDRYDLLRTKLLATPDGLEDLSVEATFTHLRSQAIQIEGIRPPYRERRDPNALYGVFRTRVDSITLRPRWTLGNASTISSIASFGWSDVDRYAPPGLGETRSDQFDRTLEATLVHQGQVSGFVAGVSHSELVIDQWIDLRTVGLGIGNFDDRQSSFGVFGEAWLKPVDRLTATIGLRFQVDRQRRSGGLEIGPDLRAIDYDRRFTWLLPKFSLALELSENSKVGFLVQKAANPGGTTLVADRATVDEFGAEELWDYELFLRGNVLSGSVRYEANLFYYDMSQAQRSVTRAIETPGGTFFLTEIGNVPKAWSRGAEVQVAWQVVAGLELAGSIGLLDTKIVEAPEPDDPLVGKQFQRSPHVTASLQANWQATRSLSFNLGYFHRSGYFDDDLNTPSRRLDGAQYVNARASWESGRLRIFVFGRNVFDRFYLNSLTSNGLATAGDPREFGLGVERRF